MIVKREISVKYRNTFLGIGWALLQPLLNAFIFVIVFYYFAKMPVHGNSAFSFYFAGLIPWFLFSTAINRAHASLVSYQYMISKVYFPKIILPLTSCITTSYDNFFQIISFFIISFFLGVGITWKVILIIPAFVGLFLISFGVSLWVAVLSVMYRDISYIVPFFIQVLFFLTPVFYTYNNIPERFRTYALFNPLVAIEECYRWVLLPQYSIGHLSFFIPAFTTIIIVVSGLIFFNIKDAYIADIL